MSNRVSSISQTYTLFLRLQNKTAIITGGDSGIGRAAAIMFAREGCSGITVSHLPEEYQDAQDAKSLIEEAGCNVNLFSGDLMEEENCKKLVDSHLQKFGQLNILVNNASKQMYVLSKLKNLSVDRCLLFLIESARVLMKSIWRMLRVLSALISCKCLPSQNMLCRT